MERVDTRLARGPRVHPRHPTRSPGPTGSELRAQIQASALSPAVVAPRHELQKNPDIPGAGREHPGQRHRTATAHLGEIPQLRALRAAFDEGGETIVPPETPAPSGPPKNCSFGPSWRPRGARRARSGPDKENKADSVTSNKCLPSLKGPGSAL